jgi:hypothetical protein
MAGLVSAIPVWGYDSACAKEAKEDIFLSFLKILKTTVLNFMKATPGLQFDGAIYVINPAGITYHGSGYHQKLKYKEDIKAIGNV